MTIRVYPSIKDIEVGDHLCCLYKTEEEHRALILSYIRQGLQNHEKVIYIIDTHTANTVFAYLIDDGVDVNSYLEQGQLQFLTSDESYLQDGVFNPDKMINLLQDEIQKALAKGYTALRITGEMTWALRQLPGSERLIEYETKLNFFFPNSKALALCQYDMNQFSPELLLEVVRTHPIVVIGTEIYHNFYYIPPSDLSKGLEPAKTLRYWLENLKERKQIEMKYLNAYNQSEFYRDLLAHDINNIFQSILFISEHCARQPNPGPNLELIKNTFSKIEQQIDRGTKLISTIYKIAQLESSQIPLERTEVLEILHKAIEYIESSANPKKIDIKLDCELETLYTQANSILLDVFENLLYNAIKHNKSPSVEIEVRVSRYSKREIVYLKVEFMDNGIGIPDDQKQIIFQRKYRSGSLETGMGLGLSLVKNAIDSYKGEIYIKNRVKGDYTQGSNFIVLLPEAL
jgi:signal transduction histidine kinase